MEAIRKQIQLELKTLVIGKIIEKFKLKSHRTIMSNAKALYFFTLLANALFFAPQVL